jgi:hypothetical protein
MLPPKGKCSHDGTKSLSAPVEGAPESDAEDIVLRFFAWLNGLRSSPMPQMPRHSTILHPEYGVECSSLEGLFRVP